MALDFRDAAKNTAVGIAVCALFLEPYVVGHGGSPSRYLLPDFGIVAIFAWRFRTRGIEILGLAVSAKHILLIESIRVNPEIALWSHERSDD